VCARALAQLGQDVRVDQETLHRETRRRRDERRSKSASTPTSGISASSALNDRPPWDAEERPLENLPVLGLRRSTMLRRSALEPGDHLRGNIADDELAHRYQ
jgi:hypothetical protein